MHSGNSSANGGPKGPHPQNLPLTLGNLLLDIFSKICTSIILNTTTMVQSNILAAITILNCLHSEMGHQILKQHQFNALTNVLSQIL